MLEFKDVLLQNNLCLRASRNHYNGLEDWMWGELVLLKAKSWLLLLHLLHTSSLTVHGRTWISKKSCSSLCAYLPRKCKWRTEPCITHHPLAMAKFLMGFCCSYFCGGAPYSRSGLTAVSQWLKAGDRNPHVMILLKYIFYYIHDPLFSPNLTTEYNTKAGSLTKRTFCMGKIILVNPIGFPHTSPCEHFENMFLHGVLP